MAGQLVVTFGDTSAIWRAHQEDVTDFDILFKMLSSKPDKEFVFSYKVALSRNSDLIFSPSISFFNLFFDFFRRF